MRKTRFPSNNWAARNAIVKNRRLHFFSRTDETARKQRWKQISSTHRAPDWNDRLGHLPLRLRRIPPPPGATGPGHDVGLAASDRILIARIPVLVQEGICRKEVQGNSDHSCLPFSKKSVTHNRATAEASGEIEASVSYLGKPILLPRWRLVASKTDREEERDPTRRCDVGQLSFRRRRDGNKNTELAVCQQWVSRSGCFSRKFRRRPQPFSLFLAQRTSQNNIASERRFQELPQ